MIKKIEDKNNDKVDEFKVRDQGLWHTNWHTL